MGPRESPKESPRGIRRVSLGANPRESPTENPTEILRETLRMIPRESPRIESPKIERVEESPAESLRQRVLMRGLEGLLERVLA